MLIFNNSRQRDKYSWEAVDSEGAVYKEDSCKFGDLPSLRFFDLVTNGGESIRVDLEESKVYAGDKLISFGDKPIVGRTELVFFKRRIIEVNRADLSLNKKSTQYHVGLKNRVATYKLVVKEDSQGNWVAVKNIDLASADIASVVSKNRIIKFDIE